jgi:hypothetical protein
MNHKRRHAETALQALAKEYTYFTVEEKRVPIPYVLGFGRWQFWKSSGKGSPTQIRNELIRTAKQQNFNLVNTSAQEISRFMKMHRIGIDCSGLAYHLLDTYFRTWLNRSVASIINRFPGQLGQLEKIILSPQRYRRINAATLTSPLNTILIPTAEDVQISDLISISSVEERDHILVVTKVENDYSNSGAKITYIHSSSKSTQKQGPHYGEIRVTAPKMGLEHQQWMEKTKTGGNYGQDFYHPELGDGIRRLKILA